VTLGALVAAGGTVKILRLRTRRPVVGSIEHPAQS
jgi:hypothetical protein